MENEIVSVNAFNSLSQENNSQYLFFELAGKLYVVDSVNVVQAIMLPYINIPQKMPNHIIGFINYGVLTVNVIDLRSILNLEQKQYSVNDKVIILKTDEMIFAVIVDNIIDIIQIPQSEIKAPPINSTQNFINMIYCFDSSIVSFLDLSSIEELVKSTQLEAHMNETKNLFPQDEKSVAILEERSNMLIKKAQGTSLINKFYQDQFIIFTVNSAKYCINIKYIKEFAPEKNIKITKIPYTPSYVEGVINLRGNFYTIIDLKSFLGFDYDTGGSKKSQRQVIVIDSEEFKLGFMVDSIKTIINISSDDFVHKVNPKFESKYTLADFIQDDVVYSVLNMEKILADEKLFINIEM